MKYAFLLVVLVICAVAYLYYEQPKIWNDCLAAMKAPEVVSPAPPIATAATNAPPDATAPTNSEASTPPNAPNVDTPTGSIPNTNTGVTIPKVFTPPEPIPAQANWTWTVLGKDYNNVVVTKVEADKVHIAYDGDIGSINQVDLPPELQKMFNYDPELARQAANEKRKVQSVADEVEIQKEQQAAIQKQQEQAQANVNSTTTTGNAPASANSSANIQLQQRIQFLENDIDEKQRILRDTGYSTDSYNRTHGSYDQIIADDKKELATYGVYNH